MELGQILISEICSWKVKESKFPADGTYKNLVYPLQLVHQDQVILDLSRPPKESLSKYVIDHSREGLIFMIQLPHEEFTLIRLPEGGYLIDEQIKVRRIQWKEILTLRCRYSSTRKDLLFEMNFKEIPDFTQADPSEIHSLSDKKSLIFLMQLIRNQMITYDGCTITGFRLKGGKIQLISN